MTIAWPSIIGSTPSAPTCWRWPVSIPLPAPAMCRRRAVRRASPNSATLNPKRRGWRRLRDRWCRLADDLGQALQLIGRGDRSPEDDLVDANLFVGLDRAADRLGAGQDAPGDHLRSG